MTPEERELLRSLLERVSPARNGLHRLIGPITPLELAALTSALGEPSAPLETRDRLPEAVPEPPVEVELNLRLLATDVITGPMLCVDFGTAASKAAYDTGADDFEPLAIGKRAGEPNPFWTASAIGINVDGKMVFGARALAAESESGQPAVTSFKSRLWAGEAKLGEVALRHGTIEFSYRDCIQAYLAFLTHCLAVELEAKGQSRYVPRRYTMPFAYDPSRKVIRDALGQMLGQAAILADTFSEKLLDGVDAATMRSALDQLPDFRAPEWLVSEDSCVGEPVAAGNFAMDSEEGQLTVYMIADIGAGTTDFCILCLKNLRDGRLETLQIRDGSLSIETAGLAVDAALVDFLVREQAGEEFRAEIAAQSSSIKERLFAPTAAPDAEVVVELSADRIVYANRTDFLKSGEWSKLVKKIVAGQAQCFDRADQAYLQNFGSGAIRVVITGGGSALPLSKYLTGKTSKGKVKVKPEFVAEMPLRVRQRFATILADLPRLAVALGGSRRDLPVNLDRTDAVSGSGKPGPFVYKPFDKTESGIDLDH